MSSKGTRTTLTSLKLPEGQKWILGQVIGAGLFGEVYSVVRNGPNLHLQSGILTRDQYAIKLDLLDGQLYAEISMLSRFENWREERKLKFLGIPKYISYGINKINGIGCPFLVMERFGDDLQKFLTKNGNRFSDKTVVNLGIQILDVLEYLHGCRRVHNDVKAKNIVVDPTCCDRVYLIDLGICHCYRWNNGKHITIKQFRSYVPKHFGSLCCASRDLHDGVFSRRGDFEVLAYNLLLWSSGKLPWEKEATLKNRNVVQSSKLNYFEDVDKLFDVCYGDTIPCPGYQNTPNYDGCRQFLKEGLAKTGIENNGKLDLIKVVDDSTRLETESKRKCRKRKGRTLNEQLPVERTRPRCGTLRGPSIPIQSDDGNEVKGKKNRMLMIMKK